MKILFASCNINHHQAPFVLSLKSILGEGNVFYATERMIEPSRQNMGFNTYSGDWIIDINNDYDKFVNHWRTADIVLYNLREYTDLVAERLKQSKLTFYFSERWFKEPAGLIRLVKPHMWSLLKKYREFSKSNYFYYLPQGYFAYNDLSKFGICKGKSYAFGYITPIEEKTDDYNTKILPTSKTNILWAGSLYKLKRVDLLARAFNEVRKKNPEIFLTIVGEGPELNNIKSILGKESPSDSFRVSGFVNNAILRQMMNEADIYVFPSNGAEGWGAVVNEAMAENCAVVLSSKVGSVSMIEHGTNGLVFESGSLESLTTQLDKLVVNHEYLEQVKAAGKRTILDEWNPDNVAQKFMKLCDSLTRGNLKCFQSGVFKSL